MEFSRPHLDRIRKVLDTNSVTHSSYQWITPHAMRALPPPSSTGVSE
jgi:hypothetical protein